MLKEFMEKLKSQFTEQPQKNRNFEKEYDSDDIIRGVAKLYDDDDQFETTDEHLHQWVQTAKTYAPPRRQLIQGLEGQQLEYALFGVTTFLSQCIVCRQSQKEIAVGSEVAQLDELIDKTELYGPQYFQRDGITYTLQRYIPANQSTDTVPLR